MSKISSAKLQFTPEEAGYSSERLNLLNGFFQKMIDDGTILCALYGLARGGKIFAHGAQGKQKVDVDNSEFDMPNLKDITIQHLLTHTSGIRSYADTPVSAYDQSWWNLYSQPDYEHSWIRAMLTTPLTDKPGMSSFLPSRTFQPRPQLPLSHLLNLKESGIFPLWLVVNSRTQATHRISTPEGGA